MDWANGMAIPKRKYVAILQLSITPISHLVHIPDKLFGYTPFPKRSWETPFRTILTYNLLERMIHLSHEPVFFKVPIYLECCISSYEKHNGKSDSSGGGDQDISACRPPAT
jgi:hypothetical protein